MTPGEIATLRRRAQDADAGAEDNSEDLLAAVAEIERLRAAIAELDAAWVYLDAVFPRGGDLRAAAVKRLDAARTAAGVRATSD